ncbi:HAD family hydrolase [Vibrio ostreicida]|uniref:HAD family hydrolase n=1 Tax=Vibrio ostreicida TaxID=526588 RepID=UPI003B5B71B3
MKTTLFTDIDDCLIATEKKHPQGTALDVAALDIDGNPRSFVSPKQKALLNIFSKSNSNIIPVTGRSLDTLNRVNITALFNSWKVVSHGALIIDVDGNIDSGWMKHQRDEFSLPCWSELLNDLNHRINQLIESAGLAAASYVVSEGDVDCYICIKCQENTDYNSVFDQACDLLTSVDMQLKIHINGRNMALLPPYTSKARAVEYLIKSHSLDKNTLMVSLGDSLSDLPFMKKADFALMPTNSQISNNVSW